MNLKEQEKKLNIDFTVANSNKISGTPSYTSEGLKYNQDYKTDYKLVEKIEILIKALGTMVLTPEYETGDDFVKRYAGNIQKPILEGERREDALNIISQLISQL